MTSQDQQKMAAARAAIGYVRGGVLGVGTGSTVNYFIAALADKRHNIEAAVSSSEATTRRLRSAGIEVIDLNESGSLTVYVDGADEADKHLRLIKGGGGALTREKVIAAASRQFICIVDQSKMVPVLGRFPLPVEVIPMARSFVSREMIRLGGRPVYREDTVTDNGNVIIDVHDLKIEDPVALEQDISLVPGVVTAGLFARRPADVLLVAGDQGIQTITRKG